MQEIYPLIKEVTNQAAIFSITCKDDKEKSSKFIKYLHHELEVHYAKIDSNIVVFSKMVENKKFKRSEYLFDILVAEISSTNSIVKKTVEIPFIKKAIIALESEFARNIRESLIDFSKLICSNADYKIMILPNTKKLDNYRIPIEAMIDKNTKDNITIIFVDHPSKWKPGKDVETKYFIWKDCGFYEDFQQQ